MANVFFTRSALDRIQANHLSQVEVNDVIKFGHASAGKNPGSSMFQKDGIVVIAARKGSDWLVISCWRKQQMAQFKGGSVDSRYKNASFWKRIWLDLISTFGL